MSSYRKAEVTDAVRIEISSPLDLGEMTLEQQNAWAKASDVADELRKAFRPAHYPRNTHRPHEVATRAGQISEVIHKQISRTPTEEFNSLPDSLALLPGNVANLAQLVSDLALAVRIHLPEEKING